MLRYFSVLFAIVFATVFVGYASSETYNFRPEMALGRGIDGTSGALRGTCVEFDDATVSAGGQIATFGIQRLTNSEEFRNELSLDVSASYSSFASGRLEFKQQQEFNRFSEYALATARVENSAESLDQASIRLTAHDEQLLQDGRADRFIERCGTHFLSTIVTGGEFFALFEFSTETSTELEDIRAKAKANYGVFEASAEFVSKLESMTSSESFELDVYREGDNGGTLPTEATKAVEYAASFPEIIMDSSNAIPFVAISQPYTNLPGADFGDSATNNIRYNRELDLIAFTSNVYSDDMSDLRYVIENPSQFEEFDADKRSEILAVMGKVRGVIRALDNRGFECALREFDKCFTPDLDAETLDLNVIDTLPKRKKADDLTEKQLAACSAASGFETRVVDISFSGEDVTLVVRSEGNNSMPRYRKFTAAPKPKKPSELLAQRTASVSGSNAVATTGTSGSASSNSNSDNNQRFAVFGFAILSMWLNAGDIDRETLSSDCAVYRDSQIKTKGEMCYSVQAQGDDPTSSNGDTACVDID